MIKAQYRFCLTVSAIVNLGWINVRNLNKNKIEIILFGQQNFFERYDSASDSALILTVILM